MKTSMTREENQGLRWASKFHPLGKMSNFMNGMTYQPAHPPGLDTLDNPLPPLHRAEVLEVMQEKGIPEPDRRLNWHDYYSILCRRPTDPYENSPFKAEWEKAYPEFADQIAKEWTDFLEAIAVPK